MMKHHWNIEFSERNLKFPKNIILLWRSVDCIPVWWMWIHGCTWVSCNIIHCGKIQLWPINHVTINIHRVQRYPKTLSISDWLLRPRPAYGQVVLMVWDSALFWTVFQSPYLNIWFLVSCMALFGLSRSTTVYSWLFEQSLNLEIFHPSLLKFASYPPQENSSPIEITHGLIHGLDVTEGLYNNSLDHFYIFEPFVKIS